MGRFLRPFHARPTHEISDAAKRERLNDRHGSKLDYFQAAPNVRCLARCGPSAYVRSVPTPDSSFGLKMHPPLRLARQKRRGLAFHPRFVPKIVIRRERM